MIIPTEEHWKTDAEDWPRGFYPPDSDYAKEKFFGKSFEEATLLIPKDPLNRMEDLHWMPIRPFQFYFPAYALCLERGLFSDLDACTAASCFIGMVKLKLLEQPHFILPVYEQLTKALELVVFNQERFDADEDIFGSFEAEYREIVRLRLAS